MKRRRFLISSGALGIVGCLPVSAASQRSTLEQATRRRGRTELRSDVVIVGGGLGGCAAAIAILRAGFSVIMTEETDWVGGQLTQQGVPPDEHRWIESHGCTQSYRVLRNGIREYYRKYYPLTSEALAKEQLNPGEGSVSRLCHEPRVALAVLESMLAPYRSTQQLQILLEHQAIGANTNLDEVQSVRVRSLRTGNELQLHAPFFVDATELGDLLPLAKVEHITGAESRREHGEPHAPESAQPTNQQAFTACFAIDYLKDEDHRIEKPGTYDRWREYVPRLNPPWTGRLLSLAAPDPQTLKARNIAFNPQEEITGPALNLWRYRRIAKQTNFRKFTYPGDISLINWPQNDYWLGTLTHESPSRTERHIERAKDLSRSLLYWLQTEAPRPDGGQGWPGLRFRGDLFGTEDGFAKYPYIRESRRIRAVFTVTEQHCGRQARAQFTGQSEAQVRAESYPDSVGVGHYNIDLHPSTGGNNYIDVPSLPFQIPLGALLPIRVRNLLPACKNIGSTHITNGCYRLHPVEWNIGEAAGALVAFALSRKTTPHAIRENPRLLASFQDLIRAQGIETHWPS